MNACDDRTWNVGLLAWCWREASDDPVGANMPARQLDGRRYSIISRQVRRNERAFPKSSSVIPSAQKPMGHIMWLRRVRRERVGAVSVLIVGQPWLDTCMSLCFEYHCFYPRDGRIVQGHNLPFRSARVLTENSQKLSHVSGLCLRRWHNLFPTCSNCWIAYDIQISPTNGHYPLKFIHLRRQTIFPHE